MTPTLALVWDVKSAVVTSIILGTVALLPQLVQVRGSVRVGRVTKLLLGFVVGVPVGVIFLDRLDSDLLQVAVGITVGVVSVLVFAAPTVGGRDETTTGTLVAGALSGSIGASTSLTAPPVVLYLLPRELDMTSFRASILAYFLPSNLLAIAAFAVVGRISADIAILCAAAVPAVVLGVISGAGVRRRLTPEGFRAVAIAVLLVTSIAALISAVVGAA